MRRQNNGGPYTVNLSIRAERSRSSVMSHKSKFSQIIELRRILTGITNKFVPNCVAVFFNYNDLPCCFARTSSTRMEITYGVEKPAHIIISPEITSIFFSEIPTRNVDTLSDIVFDLLNIAIDQFQQEFYIISMVETLAWNVVARPDTYTMLKYDKLGAPCKLLNNTPFAQPTTEELRSNYGKEDGKYN